MYKFLIILLLLAGSSLFVVESFAFDHTAGSQPAPEFKVEIQKESERIIESKGWLTPELHSFQEQLRIIIDHTNSKNRLSIDMLSTNPNDIRFPNFIENISSDPRVVSYTLTNQFACSPNHIDRGCVIITIKREGLGDTLDEIRNNAREIADGLVGDGVIIFGVEFDSITLEATSSFDGNKKMTVAKVLYTTNKQATANLFGVLSTLFISSDIREAGGFYDEAVKLSEHHFSDFTVTFVPLGNNALRSLHVSLTCSDTEVEGLPNCPGQFDDMLARGELSPLDMIQADNISRSELFADEFLPLNSIIHVLIYSEEGLQVKSINSDVIEKLEHLGNVQENGWFFHQHQVKKLTVDIFLLQNRQLVKMI